MPLSLTIIFRLAATTGWVRGPPEWPEIGSVRNERQALAAADVDHDQDTHAAAVDELLGQTPTVWKLWGGAAGHRARSGVM